MQAKHTLWLKLILAVSFGIFFGALTPTNGYGAMNPMAPLMAVFWMLVGYAFLSLVQAAGETLTARNRWGAIMRGAWRRAASRASSTFAQLEKEGTGPRQAIGDATQAATQGARDDEHPA